MKMGLGGGSDLAQQLKVRRGFPLPLSWLGLQPGFSVSASFFGDLGCDCDTWRGHAGDRPREQTTEALVP